jgi:nucleoside-diphosphate-sugar epimerase
MAESEARLFDLEQLKGMCALVTGAGGFVGTALCSQLERAGITVRRVVRTPTGTPGEWILDDTSSESAWREALAGVGVVVHLAARVHVVNDRGSNAAVEFHRVNVEMTRRIAAASIACGVRRFVYLSSIKVNGDSSVAPYREDDPPHPDDDYGTSKWEAEQLLAQMASESHLELAILRPPLVYGPGVRGNFLRLMRMVGKRYPLPLGSVRNLRSFVYLGNLVDAIVLVMRHPAAAGVFLIRDGEDLSTPDLLRRLAWSMGGAANLVPVPVPLIRFAARIAHREADADRLVGSLQVDDARLRTLLGWQPPFSVDQGLRATAEWYRDTHDGR